jgi:hypothetical protein
MHEATPRPRYVPPRVRTLLLAWVDDLDAECLDAGERLADVGDSEVRERKAVVGTGRGPPPWDRPRSLQLELALSGP